MNPFLLAFDIGTTGNKAVLVDATTGTIIDSETASYPTRYLSDGGAEQSPSDWWASVVTVCRALTARQPHAMRSVASIGCAGMMNGVVLVDRHGNALRDAIIHADVRSAPQCAALEEAVGRDNWFRETANRPDPHLTLPKLAWMRKYEPGVLARSACVVQAKDYVVGRLTGVTGVTDPSDASLTGAFNVAERVWSTDLVKQAGIDTKLLPRIVPSTQIVGTVTSQASRETGLREGIPVVMGGGDGACATAGSGAGPGDAYNYLGGTSWIGLNAASPIYDIRLSHYCSLDERVTVFGTVQSAGSSLEWFVGLFAGDEFIDYAAMDQLAASVPPGARNLFFMPYLQGERAPLWDSNARGVFFGLATHHGKPEMFRAVVEGVSYALASILDVFAENGQEIPHLRLLGGGAKSDLWRTILAAITHRLQLTVSDVSSATSLGAAMAAGVGVGLFPSIADAARKLVAIAREDPPDTFLASAYAPRAAFFKTLYPALAGRFAALAEL